MSTRQPPKKQRLAPGRSGVLEAALALFARDGIDGVSLQQIADSLSVTKAAVYHHFQAKSDIVLEALKPGLEVLGDAVRQAETLPAGPRQAQTVIAGLADCIAKNARSYQIIMADSAAARILETDPQLVRMFICIRAMLAGEHPDAQMRLAVSCFLGACLGPSLDPEFDAFTAQQLHDTVISAGELIVLSRLT
ncbi:helix-turn-helix domain-containing protein [Glutamicibacter sp.]|uniref:TetR/AcrR family transcriptional regulator n=1 Tax=Glutamicibacter sp. TaxID=1931995 RepID=UPI0028BD1D71|nr:helix-turn-helix domain-containing protein [Glutamicibacter sp.]